MTPWQDPHNSDPAFTRVRLRHEAIPLLDDVLGGGVVPALARTADLLADDLEALDQLTEVALDDAIGGDGSLDVAAVASHPAAIRRRVLRLWAGRVGNQGPIRTASRPLTADHLYRLDGLLTEGRSGRAVRLPGGIDAIRRGPLLVLVQEPDIVQVPALVQEPDPVEVQVSVEDPIAVDRAGLPRDP
jgi:tRNA(Ile)-lysidine synthase